MEMKILRNGLKSSSNRKRRKRRNPATPATKTATPKRRNGVSKSSVTAYLKRNGLKAVKPSANPKRKRSKRRRNGLTVAQPRKVSNGLLGNSKQDAIQVGAVIGGAAITQAIGGFLQRFASPYASSFGVGQYTGLIAKGVTALMLVPMVAGMITRKPDVKSFARIGGLVVFGIDIINQFFPQVSLNPFSTQPLVLANGQALLTPSGAVGLAAAAGADNATVNKMAGAISAVASGGGSAKYATYQNPSAVMDDGWD